MTAINPTLAAAIAATGVPLSADHAPQPAERIVRDALGSVQGTIHHLPLGTLEVLAERLTAALQQHALVPERDHAPLSPAREQQIRALEPAPPGLVGLGQAGSESERRLYGRAVELHAANRELLAEIGRLRGELAATSQPDETEYAVRMPGSNDVWPRREFRMGHWERVLREGGVLLERVIRRGPWTEAPNQCPGFEGNPVAPDQCAGCGETNDAHEEAGR